MANDDIFGGLDNLKHLTPTTFWDLGPILGSSSLIDTCSTDGDRKDLPPESPPVPLHVDDQEDLVAFLPKDISIYFQRDNDCSTQLFPEGQEDLVDLAPYDISSYLPGDNDVTTQHFPVDQVDMIGLSPEDIPALMSVHTEDQSHLDLVQIPNSPQSLVQLGSRSNPIDITNSENVVLYAQEKPSWLGLDANLDKQLHTCSFCPLPSSIDFEDGINSHLGFAQLKKVEASHKREVAMVHPQDVRTYTCEYMGCPHSYDRQGFHSLKSRNNHQYYCIFRNRSGIEDFESNI